MKINEIKNVFAFCMGCLALLAGCGGFTEDVNGNVADHSDEANHIESQYAQARVLQSGKVVRSSASDSIMLILEVNGGCVNQSGSIVYNPDFYYRDTSRYAYSFRGDTLLLTNHYVPDRYEVDQTEYDESFILVGGTSGKLDGVWFFTQCRYREEKIYCSNYGYDTYVEINGNKVEYRVADREDYDYMQTVFVWELFMFLGSHNSIQLETPFYYTDTKYEQEEYGISILEKTKKSMKFSYNGLTFDLNVDYAYYKDSLSVTLKSGDVTCVGKHREIVYVQPEMCSAAYAGNFYEIEDTGLLKYEKQNDSEFEACIDGILGREREW
jgi:hypothetical protein